MGRQDDCFMKIEWSKFSYVQTPELFWCYYLIQRTMYILNYEPTYYCSSNVFQINVIITHAHKQAERFALLYLVVELKQ